MDKKKGKKKTDNVDKNENSTSEEAGPRIVGRFAANICHSCIYFSAPIFNHICSNC